MKIPNFKEWSELTFSLKSRERALKLLGCHPGFSSKLHEPCWECKGTATVQVAFGPYDYSDEVCHICTGDGFLAKGCLKSSWQVLKDKEKEEAAKEKQIATELKRIKAKLTSKEVAFLEMYL